MPTTYAGADSFPTLITLPSDGDDKTAASVNTPLEGLADRTVWLQDRLALGNIFEYGNNTNSGGDPVQLEAIDYNTFTTTWTNSGIVFVNIAGCVAFDQLYAQIHVGSIRFDGTFLGSFRLYATDDFGGAAVQAPVLYSHAQHLGGTTEAIPLHLSGRHSVSFNGICRVGLQMRFQSTEPGKSIFLDSGIHLLVHRVRG